MFSLNRPMLCLFQRSHYVTAPQWYQLFESFIRRPTVMISTHNSPGDFYPYSDLTVCKIKFRVSLAMYTLRICASKHGTVFRDLHRLKNHRCAILLSIESSSIYSFTASELSLLCAMNTSVPVFIHFHCYTSYAKGLAILPY